MWQNVKGLRESAGLDPEKKMPPKEIWFDGDELEKWFDDRQKLRVKDSDG